MALVEMLFLRFEPVALVVEDLDVDEAADDAAGRDDEDEARKATRQVKRPPDASTPPLLSPL